MAEFCKKCMDEIIGVLPDHECYDSWLVKNDGICEGCGYRYLEEKEAKE